MHPFREILLVFRHELHRALRSAKSLVLLILYGLATGIFGLAAVAATRSLQESLNSAMQGQDLTPAMLMELKMGGLALVFGKDEAQIRYLASMPLIVVLVAWFALFFMPVLAALLGFDQVSGELHSRSLRFVSMRARRGSILAGKLLAQLALLFGLTAVVNVGIFVYAALTIADFPILTGVVGLLRFWILAAIYASVYLGLAALCSSLFRTPIYSLLVSFSALAIFAILGLMSHFDELRFLGYLAPSHYKDGLFSPDPITLLSSVAVLVAFAAAFVGAAYLALRERDL